LTDRLTFPPLHPFYIYTASTTSKRTPRTPNVLIKPKPQRKGRKTGLEVIAKRALFKKWRWTKKQVRRLIKGLKVAAKLGLYKRGLYAHLADKVFNGKR